MVTGCHQLQTLDELRQYVNQILCDQHQLQIGAFQLTERVLLRGRKPCGIFFCLHGPRAVKFTAIWETDRNRILFYGSGGERFRGIQLTAGPRLDEVLAS